ncbi:response regulator [Dyadobacter fermentans]|uniref:Response regulator receiver protein n=1 Tax=Dyadobacter fermentans (strain ATCC 700827 / DSM 18053 / CIP 107007 / KCTC 52180 / NS114) TaxID=471854 RepID=C6VRQ9_DYAFD|nr:response regulator [Dyadobacter fermentans]ACT92762.1 response regulator receiver protein [Dyadobacter fermentans DSM 18053]
MKRNTVIIADDDADDRYLIGEALNIVGQRRKILEVEDGRELVDLLANDNPNPELILVDMNMPRMNGVEVLDAIQAFAGYGDVPKIVLSNDSQNAQKAYQAGADGFYTKPVTLDGYLDVARRILKKYLGGEPPKPLI